MRSNHINIKNSVLALSTAIAVLSACNKAPEEIGDIPVPTTPTGSSLADVLRTTADDSLFYKVVVRGGLQNLLNNKANTYTVFSPNNAAIRQFVSGASGGAIPPAGAPEAQYVGFINTLLPVASAAGVASYHIVPQNVPAASFGAGFANFPYPTTLNPSPAASPLLRLDAYLSRRTQGAWMNNVPVIAPNRAAANGTIHSIAAVSVPPSTLIWNRIDTDADLTYLKAAIQRADSGAAANSSIQYLLGTQSIAPGLNLTLFAPNNAAFVSVLTVQATPIVYNMIYQQAYAAAITGGATPAQAQVIATNTATAQTPAQTAALVGSPTVFQNPALYPYLTAQTVKGIIVYHVLFGQRAFTPNLPTTATSFPTFLNSAVPTHPGISITATFTGPMVSAATVKGVANPSASNVIINPLPNGSSDQHYVNGVLHKIDQVMFPM